MLLLQGLGASNKYYQSVKNNESHERIGQQTQKELLTIEQRKNIKGMLLIQCLYFYEIT